MLNDTLGINYEFINKKSNLLFYLKKYIYSPLVLFLSFGFVKLSLVAIAINTVNILFLLS